MSHKIPSDVDRMIMRNLESSTDSRSSGREQIAIEVASPRLASSSDEIRERLETRVRAELPLINKANHYEWR